MSTFDIFTLSETWLNSSVTDLEIETPGYVIYHIDRQAQNSGRVCAYVSWNYTTEYLSNISLTTTNCGLKSTLGTWSLSLSVQLIDHRTLPYLISIQISRRTLFMPRNYRLENSDNPEAKVLINFCCSYDLSILITIYGDLEINPRFYPFIRDANK